MRRLSIVATVAVLAATLVPLTAFGREGEPGCFVYGDGPTLDLVRTCTYTAVDTEQLVVIGTHLAWDVVVTRDDEYGQPQNVILAEGVGPQPGPVYVGPLEGETVSVNMYQDVIVVQQGTVGFLWAGADDGYVPSQADL